MNRKHALIGLLIALAVAMPSGIYLSQRDQPSSTRKIGAVLSLTGPGGEAAGYIKQGIELALEESRAPGHLSLEIKYADSKSNPKDGLAAYQQLMLSDSPEAVISMLSSVTKVLVEQNKENKTVLIGTAVGLPKVAEPSECAFRIYPTGEGLAGVIARHAAARQKTAAIAFVNDDFGISGANYFKKVFEEAGGKFLAMEPFGLMEKDFRQQWSKLAQLHPECVWVIGYGPAYVAVVQQFRESGLKSELYCDMTLGIPSTREALGAAAEGIVYVDASMAPEFVERFQKRFGRPPTSYSGYAYDIISLLGKTLPEEPSPDALRGNLLAINAFPGVMGPISFDKSRDASVSFQLMRIEEGNPVALKPD